MELELHQLERRYEMLRLLDRRGLARLTASLLEHGQQIPVLVVESNGRFILIDGYRRVRALDQLGRDVVRSTVLELTESEALLLSHQLLSRARRCPLEEAWLLRELVERHGLSQRTLALQLDRSTSWVSRRLALLDNLPAEVEQALRAGKVTPQVAMKYLVPLARANANHCRRLLDALDGERVSVREMARLYAGWRAGTEQQRCHIVDNPRLYLRLDGQVEKSAEPLPGEDREQELTRKLGLVTGVCLRLRQLLRERTKQEGKTPLPVVVRFAFAEAQAGFQALAVTVAESESGA